MTDPDLPSVEPLVNPNPGVPPGLPPIPGYPSYDWEGNEIDPATWEQYRTPPTLEEPS